MLRTSRLASCRLPVAGLVPEAESAEKGVGIFSQTTMGRKLLQLFAVATTKNDTIWFQRGHKTLHDVGNITTPFLFASGFQGANPDIVFVSCLLIGEAAEFHELNDSVDDQGKFQERRNTFSTTSKRQTASPF